MKQAAKKKLTTGNALAARLKDLRHKAGLSQEAVGAQGFVSTPGWIKVENGQRNPSEKLITAFVTWLAAEKIIRASVKTSLIEELTTIGYAGQSNLFLREMARTRLTGRAKACGSWRTEPE